jgi:hypothetical protein
MSRRRGTKVNAHDQIRYVVVQARMADDLTRAREERLARLVPRRDVGSGRFVHAGRAWLGRQLMAAAAVMDREAYADPSRRVTERPG